MTKDASRGKSLKSGTETSVIRLPNLDNPDELTPLNFRVSAQFHREFKLYAVQNGMTMVDLLQRSFQLMKAHHKR